MSRMVSWNDNAYPDEKDPYGNPPLSPDIYNSYGDSSSGLKVLSDAMKSFITDFHRCITEGNLKEIENAYRNQFPKLTEQYFQKQKWPSADVIAPLVNNDDVFLTLYRELYYRHIYAHVATGPTLDERFDSYYNYCQLFNLILNADKPIPLELPNQWLWDIIDEFIYQFQSFTLFRAKLKSKTEDEVYKLRDSPRIWNIHSVLNVLHSLVKKSCINEQLRVYATRGDPNEVAGEFGSQTLYKMLGFFSLIGLCRLHCLLGDYYQSLKVLEYIDVSKQEMYSQVQTCHITTGYYVGVSYMMMRRYEDAIRSFSSTLVYVQRAKSGLQYKTDVLEYVTKQSEQMATLLAICLTLHPMRVDETVHQMLKEKFADKMIRLQKMELQEFENSFTYGCPKFLSPIPPNYDIANMNYHLEPQQQQIKVFMEEIKQQMSVPNLRSFLKLYTTLPIAKLAAFMDKSEEELHTELMCFKHKLQNMVCAAGGSSLEGEFQSGSDIDFYIVEEMIHVADTKIARRFSEFFIRQIVKLQDMQLQLNSLDEKVVNIKGPTPAAVMAASSAAYRN